MSDSSQLPGPWPARLLYSWDFPGKNTRMNCISSSRGSSQSKCQAHAFCVFCNAGGFSTAEPLAKPKLYSSKLFFNKRENELSGESVLVFNPCPAISYITLWKLFNASKLQLLHLYFTDMLIILGKVYVVRVQRTEAGVLTTEVVFSTSKMQTWTAG